MITCTSAAVRIGAMWHRYDAVFPEADQSMDGGCRGCGGVPAAGFADLCRSCIDLLGRRHPFPPFTARSETPCG